MTPPVRTTCPYCGVGCGVTVAQERVAGDHDHPSNYGRLCSKGAALGETLGLADRLLAPTIGGAPSTWDESLDLIADRFAATIREHGPDSVAFYVSGQFLTEDYYVANKLMKGFIGSGNIDTNSRLCMASSVAGHVRAFGEDIVPGCYEDLEETDLAILVGSNMAWCHPVLYQRLIAARDLRGTKLVVIDPRATATAETSDLHVQLRAGADVLLFDGLLAHLAETDVLDRDWIGRHVSGFDEALATARASAGSLTDVAEGTGVPVETLRRFYELFERTERVMTLYSQGVNQSDSGTDKVNAIINCHLATGRIGRPGMGPLSLTGQPNAMGGREVGGLANQLAAHMGFTAWDIDRVRRFWQAPNISTQPGLKAVDLFDAVHDGRIKAVWIAATNPAVSMPRAGRVREALANCPFVVVSDCWPTDTTALADVVLPAAGWAEKDGTVTNSERRISRQRRFRPLPGEARPDWWMFAELGKRLGWRDAFGFSNAAAVFREHAALSAFENEGTRVFDLGGIADIGDAAYDRMAPLQWPCPRPLAGSVARLFARGGFPTQDGRARMVPTHAPVAEAPGRDLPLRLNTGRVRDQWHTMTRTGRVPRLMTHVAAPALEIHPDDAVAHDLTDGALARLESPEGSIVLPVRFKSEQRRGEVFAPMHWTDEFSAAGPVERLVSARTDPVSGQPDLKGTAIRVTPLPRLWCGMVVRRTASAPPADSCCHWSKVPLETGFAYTLAGWRRLQEVIDSEERLRHFLGLPEATAIVALTDPRRAIHRFAAIVDGRLELCLFLGTDPADLPAHDDIVGLLGQMLAPPQRVAVLAGCAGPARRIADKPVCACFAVGAEALTRAIRGKGLKTVAEIGATLRAGTNCGSCIPELKSMLKLAEVA